MDAVQRLQWLDAARGLAILAVVLGHVSPVSQPLYWWHMPCFFCLSGFIFRESTNLGEMVSRRALQLLAPYACWLAILSLPTIFVLAAQHSAGGWAHWAEVSVYGGQKLAPPFSAYWFLTALFLTATTFAFLHRLVGRRWVGLSCALAYLLGCARGHFIHSVSFPLEVDAVLMGLPFFWIGHRFRELPERAQLRVLACGSAIFCFTLGAFFLGVRMPMVDWKNAEYGVPVVSFLIALAGSSTCVALAHAPGLIQRVLSVVGRSSLLIMLLHQQIVILPVVTTAPWPVQWLVAWSGPLALRPLIEQFKFGRRFLLGQMEVRSGSTVVAA